MFLLKSTDNSDAHRESFTFLNLRSLPSLHLFPRQPQILSFATAYVPSYPLPVPF